MSFDYTKSVLESYTKIATEIIDEIEAGTYEHVNADSEVNRNKKAVNVDALRQILELMKSIE